MTAYRDADRDGLRGNVREAVALLDAISVGGLLSRAPAGIACEAKHAAAVALLGVVRKRLVDGLDTALA